MTVSLPIAFVLLAAFWTLIFVSLVLLCEVLSLEKKLKRRERRYHYVDNYRLLRDGEDMRPRITFKG